MSGAVLSFTDVFQGDDSSNASDSRDDGRSDDGQEGSDDEGGSSIARGGASTPAEAVREYVRALDGPDCKTLRAVVLVPAQAESRKEYLDDVCSGGRPIALTESEVVEPERARFVPGDRSGDQADVSM